MAWNQAGRSRTRDMGASYGCELSWLLTVRSRPGRGMGALGRRESHDLTPQLLVGHGGPAPRREGEQRASHNGHALDLDGRGDVRPQDARPRVRQDLDDLLVDALAPVDHGE